MSDYARGNLLWGYVSKLRHVKSFVRLRVRNSILSQAILLTLEIFGIHVRLHYVNDHVKSCLGNLSTIQLRQK